MAPLARLSFLVMALILAFAPWASAQETAGFHVSGDSLKNLQLTFNATGLDRSTPEAAARSLLQTMGRMQSPAFEVGFGRLEARSRANAYRGVLTPTAFDNLCGKRLAEVEQWFTSLDRFAYACDVSVGDPKDNGDGSVTLRCEMKMTSKRPCRKCKAKEGTACSACKGTRMLDRNVARIFLVDLVREDDGWKVSKMLRSCYSCKGKGTCTRCPKKKSSRKCWSCADSGTCKSCEGKGFTPHNSFLRGPRIHGASPEAARVKLDLSSPEGAVHALLGRARELKALDRRAESRARPAFESFRRLFIAASLGLKSRKGKLSTRSFEMVASDYPTKNRARVTFAEMKAEGDSNAYRAEVVRNAEGDWRVDKLFSPCWRCKGAGTKSGKPCTTCQGSGFRETTSVPR